MPGIVLAAFVGEGIIFWRSWKQGRHFPVPGQLLSASAVFVLLMLLAEAPRARFLASALAWGFDAAALINVLPQTVIGGGGATGAKAGAQGAAAGAAGQAI